MHKTVCFLFVALAFPSWASPGDVFSQFDRWATRYRTAPASEQPKLVAEGVGLATERRAALLKLMKDEPSRAWEQFRSKVGLPEAVQVKLEDRYKGPARFERLCEFPLRQRAQLFVGQRRFDVTPHGRWGGARALDSVQVDALLLGEQAALTEYVGELELPSAWTEGNKRLLYVRVDFADDVGEPISVSSAQAVLAELNQFMQSNSYGKTSITPTVVPMVLRLPRSKASYGSANDTDGLLRDARTAARNAGYDPSTYNLDVVAFRRVSAFSWAGLGRVGGPGTWINGSFGIGVIAHEVGHNFGLSHANFWQAPNESIIGAGNAQEYGNPFDTMGSGGDTAHFGASYKTNVLNWFDPAQVAQATSSGTYRISDLEQGALGSAQGIRIPAGVRSYWVEFRPGQGGPLSTGAVIYWDRFSAAGSQSSLLLDMNPGTPTANDAPLQLGRTFVDAAAGIAITPVGVIAGSPAALDVRVNRGVFTTNRPPTVSLTASSTQVNPGASVSFTAMASDPDGDPLAYFWDFGDGSPSSNQAAQTKVLAIAREQLVRVVASDMKGGTATAFVVVRVGSPVTLRISGRVTEMGAGVEGVRVVAGNRSSFTDSMGQYVIVGVNVGTTTVTAVKSGYTLSAAFTNPVSVMTPGATGIDFTASRAGFGIFGRVTSVGAPVASVAVSAGPYTTTTNATGDFELRNVPNGQYVLTATGAPGATYAPAGWMNPLVVSSQAVTGRNFVEEAQTVTGVVRSPDGGTLMGPHTVTDGVRSTVTALSQGEWRYTFPRVPFGSYHLIATAAGQLLTPAFTNPVTVGTSPVSSKDFNAQPGEGYTVSGVVDELGAGLAGTDVALRLGSDAGLVLGTTRTDGRGFYAFPNVPNGDVSVAPTRPGFTFAPAERLVSVDGGPAEGQDFSVFGANARPVIVVPPAASPFPVVGTSATLVVLADDPAPGTEGELTYTWAQTFGPVPAMLGRNGNNAAKSTPVTFTRAGAWGFRVTVTDPGMLSVTGDTVVVVPQTPTTATVTSNSASALSIGDGRQFVVSVNDQFGQRIEAPGDVEWSVMGSCGTVSPFGRFTATAVGSCSVVASVAGLTGSAMVTVQISRVPRFTTMPSVTPSPVVGSVAQASTLADDDTGEAGLTYTWSALDPSAPVVFAPNGSNAAKQTTVTFAALGTYTLQVDVEDAQGNKATGYVTMVQVTNGLAKIAVTPAASVLKSQGTMQLGATGKDFIDGDVAVSNCTWATTAGSIDMSGRFTAGEGEGTATVTATCDGRVGSTTVSWSATGGEMKKGCGCAAGSEGGLLLALGALGLRQLKRRRRLVAALGLAALSATSLGCGTTRVDASEAAGAVESRAQALGEVVNGYPGDQERMLHVLVNQARVAGMQHCQDDAGTPVRRVPLVYTEPGNRSARFTARHMAENGCYQNDNCCVLGDAGAGPGCIGQADCSGQACARTCDAGVQQTAAQRHALLGFANYLSSGVIRNVSNAQGVFCSVMGSASFRNVITADAGTEFAAGLVQDQMLSCNGTYWELAFGQGQVQVPRIPVGSAIHQPPNPVNSTELYFAAHYYDPSRRAPRRAAVVVSGHCFDVERQWGFDDDGTYEARFADPDLLPSGCHPYYFLFTDADGMRHTYPSSGSLQVAVGSEQTCPLAYDPAPQMAADCETGESQCPANGARRPCYTADMSLVGVGECRQGTQICRNGLWGACRDMVPPFPEACDGLDNDCDGMVDEGNPGSGSSCTLLSELGACQAGRRQCVSGRLTCVSNAMSSPEVCDGIDNDCDGAIDDGFPMQACGQGMCFRMGPSCQNGRVVSCDGGAPSTEIDDGKDNDCNGQVDEGFDCRRPDGGTGHVRTIWPIPGSLPTLPCANQRQTCQADAGWSTPFGGRLPSPETCNGEDDDCDGVDENDTAVQLQLGTDRCGTGGCTVRTAPRCIGGNAVTCAPRPVNPEVCNGTDDDCDGTVDEMCACRNGDTRPCYTGPSETRGVGTCRPGTRVCRDGAITTCTGEVKPTQEVCDNQDNDCDGMIDDSCVAADGGTSSDGGAGGAGGSGGSGEVDGGTGGDGMKKPGCGCTSGEALLGVALGVLGLRRRRSSR